MFHKYLDKNVKVPDICEKMPTHSSDKNIFTGNVACRQDIYLSPEDYAAIGKSNTFFGIFKNTLFDRVTKYGKNDLNRMPLL